MKDRFIITCEHGGNRIPAAYRSLIPEDQALLNSHRGYDPGALLMATELAGAFDGSLVTSTISRLLIDLNRSIGHPRLFYMAARDLPAAVRKEIVAKYYVPYRAQVEHLVELSVAAGQRVVHISSHSFTPELDGEVRNADVGLLYHPGRTGEVALCAHWKAALAVRDPKLRVRRNYPYAGKDDGLTSYLRRRFAPDDYVGIELEINQGTVFAGGRPWMALRAMLIDTLRSANTADLSR